MVLMKSVWHTTIGAIRTSAVVPTFTSFGISQNIAELFQEMYEGISNGKVAPAPGINLYGTTSLETTLRALLG
jgi:hypothetical protein